MDLVEFSGEAASLLLGLCSADGGHGCGTIVNLVAQIKEKKTVGNSELQIRGSEMGDDFDFECAGERLEDKKISTSEKGNLGGHY